MAATGVGGEECGADGGATFGRDKLLGAIAGHLHALGQLVDRLATSEASREEPHRPAAEITGDEALMCALSALPARVRSIGLPAVGRTLPANQSPTLDADGICMEVATERDLRPDAFPPKPGALLGHKLSPLAQGAGDKPAEPAERSPAPAGWGASPLAETPTTGQGEADSSPQLPSDAGMLVTPPQKPRNSRSPPAKLDTDFSDAPTPMTFDMEEEQRLDCFVSPAGQKVSRLINMPSDDGLEDGTIVDIICGFSFVFTVAFFLGGFCSFKDRRLQMAYDFVFVASFSMCFGSCAMNVLWQTPPFYDLGMDMVTVMFHVVGLHTWFYWRHYITDPKLRAFVKSFFQKEGDSFGVQRLRLECRVISVAVVVYEIAMVGLGWAVFAQPAWEHWNMHPDPESREHEHKFAFIHAILMWIAIPSHVPTMLIGHALFFFVNRLHGLDVMRALQVVRTSTMVQDDVARSSISASRNSATSPTAMHTETSKSSRLMMHTCDLGDASQRRLDYSCASWQWWWVHVLVFTFAQLVAVTAHCRDLWHEGVDSDDRAGMFRLAYDIWHGSVGGLGLLALLVTPAKVTYLYNLLPRRFLVGLRNAGATYLESIPAGEYLSLRIRGFTIYDCPITQAWVTQFLSIVTLGLPLYITILTE